MRVHMIMQGKGGVGKTLASTLLAQYFTDKNKKIVCTTHRNYKMSQSFENKNLSLGYKF